MFTGIIRELGTINSITPDGAASRLSITTPLAAQLKEGDSVAVNGVCLTVADPSPTSWAAHLMPETLRRTNLGQLQAGMLVNLERPLQLRDRLDGHFVQGHVDGVCTVTAITPEGQDTMFTFAAPADLALYLIPKGSVALDGVSLTVVDSTPTTFRVSLLPYTVQHTTFQQAVLKTPVNMEADMIGKYIRRFTAAHA